MKSTKRISLLMLWILWLSFACADQNWPTWRGPHVNGVSPEGNPPIKWSESENIKWKVKLAGDQSNSSPVIWKDKIFFQIAVQTEQKVESKPEPAEESNQGRRFGSKKPANYYQFRVVCLDRKTGNQIWEKTVCEVLPHQGHHGDHGFASYSPVTDGKLLWTNFGSRGLYCFDLDGNLQWTKQLGQMDIRAGFGEAGSPALAGENLIILHDHEGDSFIAAFNKETGEQVWKKDRDEKTSWTTPVVTKVNGQLQVIVSGANRSRCYDAKTGSPVWECGGQTENVIPTPVLGFDRVYCTSGFRGAKLQAIQLGRTGDLSGTDAIAWEIDEATPYVPSPILVGERLYFFSGTKPELSCYNAKTGQPYYTKQKLEEINNVYASPVTVADRIYFAGRNGVTYVLKNSDTLEVLAVNKLDDGIDCSPAVIGNEIYLKGKQYLYCIAEGSSTMQN